MTTHEEGRDIRRRVLDRPAAHALLALAIVIDPEHLSPINRAR